MRQGSAARGGLRPRPPTGRGYPTLKIEDHESHGSSPKGIKNVYWCEDKFGETLKTPASAPGLYSLRRSYV
eukprot:844135-Prorocentrum_minimum.AAC.5